jgi:hypothetical protein
MRRFILAIAILAGSLSIASAQVAVDKDKIRSSDHGNVQWKVKRSGSIDVPYVILQNDNGTAATAPGVQRTWTLQTAVTTGATIASGALSISIVPSSDFAGTINGATITGTTNGGAFNVRAVSPDTLPAVVYTRSAGSLSISILR